MAVLVSPNNKNDLDLNYISENLKNLERILKKHEIYLENEFKNWVDHFKEIYGKKEANIHLYVVFALIFFIGHHFISKFILKNENLILKQKNSLKMFKKIEEYIQSNYPNLDLFEIKYFNPLFSIFETENLDFFYSFVLDVSNFVFTLKIPPEYFFDYLIQKLIAPIIRHKSGEYYTPPFLVKMMVKESYSFGETVLDPCCGSGNFLTEIVKYVLSQIETKEKKITAINKIYGFDINPISVFISKINLMYLIKDKISEVNLNLYVFDSLFQIRRSFNENFDLIIGNPPWYTYRDIESIDYQDKIKILADKLKIKPLPKNLLNLEISTIFFTKAKDTFMKEGAKIFFVITKGVITGSHTSRFRNFEGFSNIKIWTFDKQIENILNIDFICLFGQKSGEKFQYTNKEIKSYHFNLKDNKKNIGYFKNVELKLERVVDLLPYSIEEKAGKVYTKKFISKDIIKDLLPIKESYYKPLFHKGADLNPRNLIFVRYNKISNSLIRINPDHRIFKRAKSPWNKKEFKNEIIEQKYVFKVIKSTELVKFYAYDYYNVFLPLSKNDLSYDYSKLNEYAKLFYDKINNLYKKYKKDTTKHKTLMENLDRWSKLINERQLSKIKVVYNNSGSLLQSAVIQGDFLITGDLSFYDTKSLEEAFYLSAILNSDLITNQVKIMKSSRHIFKLPLDIPIKKFDVRNPNHQKIAELGEKGQELAKQNINTYIEKNKGNFTKFKVQKMLIDKLKPIFSQIDEILRREFHLK
ncbi:MAG: class I SAM-dependent DNA methyltransferase [Promethearchaeota archaeon]